MRKQACERDVDLSDVSVLRAQEDGFRGEPMDRRGDSAHETAVAPPGLWVSFRRFPWVCTHGYTLPSLRDYGNGATRAKRCNTGLTKQCKFKTDASRQD